jgi:transcription termination factor Rho
MSVLDRSALESSPLADLHAIASELGLDSFRRLRKADLIDAILARQGGEEAPAAGEDGSDEEPARPRRSRSRRAAADRKSVV